MRSLADVDRDLDQLGVSAARIERVREGIGRPEALEAVDAELASLAAGTSPARPRAAVAQPTAAVDPVVAPPERGSGLIEVSDEVLRSAELPAVLALDDESGADAPNAEIAGALSALALDLDSGETPIEMEPEPVVARVDAVADAPASSEIAGLDDPDADLGALLGEADPLLDAAPPPVVSDFADLEDEHTSMFTAEDAERFSRPPPPDASVEGGSDADFELDIEEVVLDDEELMEPEPARAGPTSRTQPPPPPRTQPPEPPKGGRPSEAPKGFLGKLLQRKP